MKNSGKKDIRILSIDGESLCKLFPDFMFNDVIDCPKERCGNFCIKDKYTEEEQKILDLIPNVKKAWFRYCPTICSGKRGDGSRFRRKCKYFEGYGEEKGDIWNFRNPVKFLYCSKVKSGIVEVKKETRDCEKRNLLVRSAVSRRLIEHFGSGCLEQVLFEECLKCSYFNKKLLKCSWKPKCKEGNKGLATMLRGCSFGNCEDCPKADKKEE